MYSGCLRESDGARHGAGRYTTYVRGLTSTTYEGEWKDDQRNGRGNLTSINGEVYKGEFKDDKRNGEGRHYWPDLPAVYDGEWKDDKMDGRGDLRGKLPLPGGVWGVYEGEFKDGKMNGRGRHTWPCFEKYNGCTVYQGEFKDNNYNGQGTITYADACSMPLDSSSLRSGIRPFVGVWSRERSSCRTYEGEWKDGMMNGQGTLTEAGGRRQSGTWRDNKFVR